MNSNATTPLRYRDLPRPKWTPWNHDLVSKMLPYRNLVKSPTTCLRVPPFVLAAAGTGGRREIVLALSRRQALRGSISMSTMDAGVHVDPFFSYVIVAAPLSRG